MSTCAQSANNTRQSRVYGDTVHSALTALSHCVHFTAQCTARVDTILNLTSMWDTTILVCMGVEWEWLEGGEAVGKGWR